MKIRLLQFNYLDGGTATEGESPWYKQISDIILGSGADIAVCCETNDPNTTPCEDRWTQVAESLPTEFVFRHQFTYPANKYPLAIASKYPVLSMRSWDSTNSGGVDIRKVIFEVELDVSGASVYVYGYHAFPRKDAESTEIRLREVGFLIARMNERAGQVRFAVGDFNTNAEGEGDRDDGRITRLMSRSGYRDCYREVHPSIEAHPGYTVVHNNRRIDFIFYADDVHGLACTSAEVYTMLPDGAAKFPSDHYALWADLEVRSEGER
jgi:endonuclease/exonuclease/phosphatase family metal-dependent hydrolase